MSTLFEAAGLEQSAPRPLADELRPAKLDEVIGQDHLLGPDGPIGRMMANNRLSSMILWGPPGTGKTTIARLLSQSGKLAFEQVSAIFTGVADLRKVFEAARGRRQTGQGTLLFVDEIHRFNKAQQDGFLPYVEDGTIILVGATTENPSFELNSALLSRAQVLVLNRLDDRALETLLERAETHKDARLPLDQNARVTLRAMADGDGRYLLNLAEDLFELSDGSEMNSNALIEAVQKRAPIYDKGRDEHYNLISALHKSIRGSDVDAALYWLARMLGGGEDPLYITRRLVRASVEDIGMADPNALVQAIAAKDAYDFIGSPEGELAIAQLVIYLATAPKSNAAYRGFSAAKKAADRSGSLMPPKNILNAPTRMMKDLGYGKDYVYEHNQEDDVSGQMFFPDDMEPDVFYAPTEKGLEKEIGRRLKKWRELQKAKRLERG